MDQFRLERGEDPSFFRLVGQIDISNVESLGAQLKHVLASRNELTLDTTALDFMDSQGLRMLIDLGQQAREQGTTVKVANCSRQLRRLLDVAVPNGIPGVDVQDVR
jgi:anti-sigma B factor antagonist